MASLKPRAYSVITKKHIGSRLKRIEDYLDFKTFIEMYYKWMDERFVSDSDLITDSGIVRLNSIKTLSDIDTCAEQFLFYYKESLAKGFADRAYSGENPFAAITKTKKEHVDVDFRRVLSHINDLFRSKGTERAVKYFFRAIYGSDSDIHYPNEDLLIPSASKFVTGHTIFLYDPDNYLDSGFFNGKCLYAIKENDGEVVNPDKDHGRCYIANASRYEYDDVHVRLECTDFSGDSFNNYDVYKVYYDESDHSQGYVLFRVSKTVIDWKVVFPFRNVTKSVSYPIVHVPGEYLENIELDREDWGRIKWDKLDGKPRDHQLPILSEYGILDELKKEPHEIYDDYGDLGEISIKNRTVLQVGGHWNIDYSEESSQETCMDVRVSYNPYDLYGRFGNETDEYIITPKFIELYLAKDTPETRTVTVTEKYKTVQKTIYIQRNMFYTTDQNEIPRVDNKPDGEYVDYEYQPHTNRYYYIDREYNYDDDHEQFVMVTLATENPETGEITYSEVNELNPRGTRVDLKKARLNYYIDKELVTYKNPNNQTEENEVIVGYLNKIPDPDGRNVYVSPVRLKEFDTDVITLECVFKEIRRKRGTVIRNSNFVVREPINVVLEGSQEEDIQNGNTTINILLDEIALRPDINPDKVETDENGYTVKTWGGKEVIVYETELRKDSNGRYLNAAGEIVESPKQAEVIQKYETKPKTNAAGKYINHLGYVVENEWEAERVQVLDSDGNPIPIPLKDELGNIVKRWIPHENHMEWTGTPHFYFIRLTCRNSNDVTRVQDVIKQEFRLKTRSEMDADISEFFDNIVDERVTKGLTPDDQGEYTIETRVYKKDINGTERIYELDFHNDELFTPLFKSTESIEEDRKRWIEICKPNSGWVKDTENTIAIEYDFYTYNNVIVGNKYDIESITLLCDKDSGEVDYYLVKQIGQPENVYHLKEIDPFQQEKDPGDVDEDIEIYNRLYLYKNEYYWNYRDENGSLLGKSGDGTYPKIPDADKYVDEDEILKYYHLPYERVAAESVIQGNITKFNIKDGGHGYTNGQELKISNYGPYGKANGVGLKARAVCEVIGEYEGKPLYSDKISAVEIYQSGWLYDKSVSVIGTDDTTDIELYGETVGGVKTTKTTIPQCGLSPSFNDQVYYFEGIGRFEDAVGKTAPFVQPIIGNVYESSGYFDEKIGVIGESSRIQDFNYYQLFSYVLSTELSKSEYIKLYKKFLHPAGYELFHRLRIFSYAFGDETNGAKIHKLIRIFIWSMLDYLDNGDDVWEPAKDYAFTRDIIPRLNIDPDKYPPERVLWEYVQEYTHIDLESGERESFMTDHYLHPNATVVEEYGQQSGTWYDEGFWHGDNKSVWVGDPNPNAPDKHEAPKRIINSGGRFRGHGYYNNHVKDVIPHEYRNIFIFKYIYKDLWGIRNHYKEVIERIFSFGTYDKDENGNRRFTRTFYPEIDSSNYIFVMTETTYGDIKFLCCMNDMWFVLEKTENGSTTRVRVDISVLPGYLKPKNENRVGFKVVDCGFYDDRYRDVVLVDKYNKEISISAEELKALFTSGEFQWQMKSIKNVYKLNPAPLIIINGDANIMWNILRRKLGFPNHYLVTNYATQLKFLIDYKYTLGSICTWSKETTNIMPDSVVQYIKPDNIIVKNYTLKNVDEIPLIPKFNVNGINSDLVKVKVYMKSPTYGWIEAHTIRNNEDAPQTHRNAFIEGNYNFEFTTAIAAYETVNVQVLSFFEPVYQDIEGNRVDKHAEIVFKSGDPNNITSYPIYDQTGNIITENVPETVTIIPYVPDPAYLVMTEEVEYDYRPLD